MSLQYTDSDRVSLKGHADFNEKWLQDVLIKDPAKLGLGDIELVTAEKIQPKAGRLDLLLHDEQLNRRYEVELMLGATDPSHILRCIEYWDIERRRYPAYDHVAVLVAEDITSRFLNLISLLAGSIPLMAIQCVALQVNGNITLHFVRVLDQTTLRTDDVYEGGSGPGPVTTDRAYWESRTSPEILKTCDAACSLVSEINESPHALRYRQRLIDIVPEGETGARVWLIPKKTLVRIGAYVPKPESWIKQFEDLGHTASLRRGNKAALVSFKPTEFDTNHEILRAFLNEAVGSED